MKDHHPALLEAIAAAVDRFTIRMTTVGSASTRPTLRSTSGNSTSGSYSNGLHSHHPPNHHHHSNNNSHNHSHHNHHHASNHSSVATTSPTSNKCSNNDNNSSNSGCCNVGGAHHNHHQHHQPQQQQQPHHGQNQHQPNVLHHRTPGITAMAHSPTSASTASPTRGSSTAKQPLLLNAATFRSLRCWLIVTYLTIQSVVLVFFHLKLSTIEIAADTWFQEVMEPGTRIRAQNRALSPVDVEEKKAALQYITSFKSMRRPLRFFHIPKTAGTAIEYAAGERSIVWGSCMFNHQPKRKICHYPGGPEWPQHIGWWHVPTQFFPLALTNPYMNSDLFGVVRDPYDRMVSEYFYICTLKIQDWRPSQCDRTRLNDKEYMNTWLVDKLQQVEKTALGYLLDNGHFTPQYEFVVGPNDVRMLDHVLRMDDTLNDDFHKLTRSYHLSHVRLIKVNALGAESRVDDLTVQDLTDHTIQWIHERYPNDFELGYAQRNSMVAMTMEQEEEEQQQQQQQQ